MRPRSLLTLAIFLMFTCLVPRTALADACDTPPPPRYQPGQVDNYPNGADVISCTKPVPGREVWRIDYPSVDRALTDYPTITFNRGDVVVLSASGCVQSGGFWNTWKRYVDPDDGNGHIDSLYYGTVQIIGITGNNNPQTIKHWIGPAFAIPTDGHLSLGYVDDDLSDNGYWNHDDGLNDQCVGSDKAVVGVEINRGAAHEYEDCSKWTNFTHNPVAPSVPELARVADLLRMRAEVPFGLPITHDAHAQAITHFQIFQDGKPDSNATLSNRLKNSAEMHGNRCLYYAYTPTMSPTWYPADLAFDKSPQKDWQARPWDASLANVSFSELEDNNRKASEWRPTFLPGYCGGAGTSWRSSAPRWIEVCAPRELPVSDWTEKTLTGFPDAEPVSAEIEHSGAICGWQMKSRPSLSDGCVDAFREEWTVVTSHDFRTVEGLFTNTFLSGDDYGRDHNGMPDGHYVGVHTDVMTHNDAVDNCAFLEVDNGQHCADWEMNVLPDANYRHLLARDESTLNDRPGGDCKAKHPTYYRLGNSAADLLGALGIEGEQWYYPVGYRPEPGDRAVVRGMWIVDCGHPDWHGELHPASMLQSSYLQTNDYAPVLGATWNRPLRLTSKWRAITNGEPAVVTKIVVSPVFAEDRLDLDVWPPARPCAGARLHVEREDLKPNPRWRRVHFTETLLPADGNPNHLHLTVTRAPPYQLDFGGDGDVTNPDSKLTFFTAYMAWWSHDLESCPSRDKD